MAIYVDPLRTYRSGRFCHMMTDGSLDELHVMAKKIGAKREWFQEHKLHPHYDLMARKRQLALANGAIGVSSTEMVMRCSKLFQNRRS